jgi:hypothetical protein
MVVSPLQAQSAHTLSSPRRPQTATGSRSVSTPLPRAVSAPSLPPLKPESPHVFRTTVTVDLSRLLEQNAKKRAKKITASSPSSPSLWLDCGPVGVDGGELWPPGKPIGMPAGALRIREHMRRLPSAGPSPGSPMYFAQDAGLETFDPDRLAEQDQTPLTCLRDGSEWVAILRPAPPQPVPPRRPPHESRGVQAGTSWRRSFESGMHLLPCTDDGSVATASALQLLCEVDEVPQPAPSATATAAAAAAPAAAPAAASRSVGTGVAPAPVRHLVDGSELLLLIERCDASRGERSMSLKGSKEKYADAAAALEDAARAALGDSADRMRLVLNPPLATLPAALRVRYKAPRRVGHQKRNYPRIGSFEYGYVLLHHGGASRVKAPLLTAAHAATHRIRGPQPAC